MLIEKADFIKQKLFDKRKISSLRTEYAAHVPEINAWYKDEEYRAIKKIPSFLIEKKKINDKNCSCEVSFDLVQRILNWKSDQESVCHYCGIREDALQRLNNQPNHENKRWPKRGKALEIDWKIAKNPYSSIDNLVLSCYWCNNAKTDTFTYKEFRQLGVQ